MPCSACGGGGSSTSVSRFNMRGKFVRPTPKPPINKNVKVTVAQYHYLKQLHAAMVAKSLTQRRTMRF